MRRLLARAVVVPALLLSACSGDADTDAGPPADAGATSTPAGDGVTGTADGTQDSTPESAQTGAAPEGGAGTAAPGDEAAATASPEERAVAERAQEWLVAFADGDPAVCDYVVDLSGEGPMPDAPEDHARCVEIVPQLLMEASDPQLAELVALMDISGADIDGGSATVGREHVSPLFADALGDGVVRLLRFDGEWYVDMDNSL